MFGLFLVFSNCDVHFIVIFYHPLVALFQEAELLLTFLLSF